MKNAAVVAFVAADAALIVVSLTWMVAGYPAWGAVALLAAFALVYAAARFWANTPEPQPAEPVEHTAWFVWDEELEDGLSDVERQMLRYGYVADPVDAHHAQMIRALSGQPAVLPEIDLLLPTQRNGARHRRDNNR